MKHFSQELVDSLDKTTEYGFAEALLIAISCLEDKRGLLLNVRLSDDPEEMVDFAKQIARTMLNKGASMKADDIQAGGTHYKDMAVQPWTVMEALLTREEFIGYMKGNIIKYAMRQGRKQESDDSGKALHYKQKLKELTG